MSFVIAFTSLLFSQSRSHVSRGLGTEAFSRCKIGLMADGNFAYSVSCLEFALTPNMPVVLNFAIPRLYSRSLSM